MANQWEYSDVGSIRFLVGMFLNECGRKIAQARDTGQAADLDAEALWLDVLSSHLTEKDAVFKEEWSNIQTKRQELNWKANEDETLDLGFRIHEMRVIVRSLARCGILTRLETPKVEWRPEV